MLTAFTATMRDRAAAVSGRLRHLPAAPRSPLTLLEYLLLALLAVQVARLLWAVVTPVGPYGAWTGRQAVIADAGARQALFSRFDPFFRAPDSGASSSPVVTSLALTVFGIRVNEGSGQGSAIIATPDGVQNSYAVGDEIMPGVILKSVAFDHVLIDRGGAQESVFLDQSVAAPVASPDGSAPSASPVPSAVSSAQAAQGITAAAVKSDIGFAPRLENGKVTGLVLSPKGPAFQTAGFARGDIVTQINGRPIGSAADLQALQTQIAPGARISLMVERGATTVPIALTLQGS
ncbi:type II secretion system protein N [Sphingobium algorifonticola]|uniref:PDZ domain-containing protein n=1 Tax=Sphingobium algorifonticola TaxID=2008318 RepID=A0A437J7I3_9SPHN|nr:type II secretion system protein N [Sphingobium algorifonticola]RVT41007.1 PDZ domain-containing protein [Sphingobium algorifonticola]